MITLAGVMPCGAISAQTANRVPWRSPARAPYCRCRRTQTHPACATAGLCADPFSIRRFAALGPCFDSVAPTGPARRCRSRSRRDPRSRAAGNKQSRTSHPSDAAIHRIGANQRDIMGAQQSMNSWQRKLSCRISNAWRIGRRKSTSQPGGARSLLSCLRPSHSGCRLSCGSISGRHDPSGDRSGNSAEIAIGSGRDGCPDAAGPRPRNSPAAQSGHATAGYA